MAVVSEAEVGGVGHHPAIVNCVCGAPPADLNGSSTIFRASSPVLRVAVVRVNKCLLTELLGKVFLGRKMPRKGFWDNV